MNHSQIPPHQPYIPQSRLYPSGGMKQQPMQQPQMPAMPMQRPMMHHPSMSPMPMQQMPMPYMQMPPHPMMSPQMSMQQMPSQQKRQGILSKMFGKKNKEQQDMPYMMPNNTSFMSTGYPLQNQQPMMYPRQQQQADNTNVRMIPPAAATSATAAPANTAGIGSFFSNLVSNPSAIVGNVEKIVQAAQTVGPVVQQYGPLVRNFPSLMKILNAVTPASSTSSTEEAKEEAITNTPEAVSEEIQVAEKQAVQQAKQTAKKKQPFHQPIEEEAPASDISSKTPMPKLYV